MYAFYIPSVERDASWTPLLFHFTPSGRRPGSTSRSPNFELCFNYLAFSMMRTSLHLFVLERGLVSITSTVSPMPHSLFSSWAWRVFVLLTILLYTGCFTWSSIATVMVLSILSLTTLPTLVFLRARSSISFYPLMPFSRRWLSSREQYPSWYPQSYGDCQAGW